MGDKNIYVFNCHEVEQILEGKEKETVDIIKNAYLAHEEGKSSLPHSVFLRFPEDDKNRIIGLPAYIELEKKMAGMKWISSFPANIEHGLERASAILALNNMDNGHVEAILESSVISAKRTAASALLGAIYLHQNMEEDKVGMIGCGRINREIMHYILSEFKKIKTIYLYDCGQKRAETFAEENKIDGIQFVIVDSVEEIFGACSLISCATTAGTPYIQAVKNMNERTTVLGISLRDFAPEVMLQVHNIVDDLDHVCRERTSIHLTEQKTGNRDFVAGSIAQVVAGKVPARESGKGVIYSPFGLGILDVALGNYVREHAEKDGLGTVIPNFLP